jgi:hypothetical protein
MRMSKAGPKPRPAPQRREGTNFEVDPFWPKPYPDRWVTGESGGICTDAHDHIFTMNRGDLTPAEQKTASASPPVIEFDPAGNIVNTWGDRDALPKGLHSCTVDFEGNIWIGGNQDGVVQKYTHDGSKMLLQIGSKGVFDTSDGTMAGAPMNSSHTLLNLPASIAVDRSNGDVYIADGYGNRRIVVFDQTGHFLRQWGRQGTVAETNSGVGGVFLKVVHCVVIGNDGLVYVCDRLGDRVEVFDKMGNFKRNILVESKTAPLTGVGSACWISFSPDTAQKFLYAGACVDGEVRVIDRASGEEVSRFGRPGNQAGGFGSVHTMTIDSQGNIYVADSIGRRIQKWKLVN